MASRDLLDTPDPGFDLVEEGDRGGDTWRKVVGLLLMGAGLAALAWGFILMLGHSDLNLPPQALQHPVELLGALGLSLLLLCAGAVVLGRGPEPATPSQDS